MPGVGAVFLLLAAAATSYCVLSAAIALRSMATHVSYAAATLHVRTDLLTLTLAQVAGMGVALSLGLHWFAGDTGLGAALHMRPVRARGLLLCLVAGACLQFPLTELSNVLHARVFGPEPLETQLALQNMIEAHSIGRGLLVVGCLVAAIPLVEEVLFRGLLLFGLERRYGPSIAVLTSACLFGVSHLGAVAAVYASVAGVLLGLLALKTRSIWPGMAMHAAVNAMPVLLPEHVWPIEGFNVPSVVPHHLPGAWVGLSLVLGLSLLAWASRIEYSDDP